MEYKVRGFWISTLVQIKAWKEKQIFRYSFFFFFSPKSYARYSLLFGANVWTIIWSCRKIWHNPLMVLSLWELEDLKMDQAVVLATPKK